MPPTVIAHPTVQTVASCRLRLAAMRIRYAASTSALTQESATISKQTTWIVNGQPGGAAFCCCRAPNRSKHHGRSTCATSFGHVFGYELQADEMVVFDVPPAADPVYARQRGMEAINAALRSNSRAPRDPPVGDLHPQRRQRRR
eukprot:scaffold74468_cov35-Phaeocystis_antarctica.AAC.2